MIVDRLVAADAVAARQLSTYDGTGESGGAGWLNRQNKTRDESGGGHDGRMGGEKECERRREHDPDFVGVLELEGGKRKGRSTG